MLVKEILSRLKTLPEVKGVYLHVLASNKHAIKFYESLGFGCCEFIPHYYSIMGHFQNAYCYMLYMHDGQPPPSPMQVSLSPDLFSSKNKIYGPHFGRVLRQFDIFTRV